MALNDWMEFQQTQLRAHPLWGPADSSPPELEVCTSSRSGSNTAETGESLAQTLITKMEITRKSLCLLRSCSCRLKSDYLLWYIENARNWLLNIWYMGPSGLWRKRNARSHISWSYSNTYKCLPKSAGRNGWSSPGQHNPRQKRGYIMVRHPPAFNPEKQSDEEGWGPSKSRHTLEKLWKNPSQVLTWSRCSWGYSPWWLTCSSTTPAESWRFHQWL